MAETDKDTRTQGTQELDKAPMRNSGVADKAPKDDEDDDGADEEDLGGEAGEVEFDDEDRITQRNPTQREPPGR